MKKPLHFIDIGDENRAILSGVKLFRVFECYQMQKAGLNEEEIDSTIWGLWDSNSKYLRPYVYSAWSLGSKIIRNVIKQTEKGENHDRM